MLIGMDVGGTNTDVAFVDGETASIKVPNSAGIDRALSHISRPGRLAVSTSTPLNRLLTQGDKKVLTILIPGMGLLYEDGMKGAVNHCGDIVEDIDRDEIDRFLRANPADAVAIAGKFSVRNPALEMAAAECARRYYPEERIALSHPLAVLDYPARIVTTRLNAMIREEAAQLVSLIGQRKKDFFFFRGDGGLTTPESALRDPSVLYNSSPAAVALGVHYLTGLKDCLAIDIGGTTTDLVPLENGIPSTEELVYGGERTVTRVIKAGSLPFGGDSVIVDSIEPRRDGNALAFGGRLPTLTDALNRVGYEIGDFRASSGLRREQAEKAFDDYCRIVAAAVEAYDPPKIAGCGYLAPILVPEIARRARKPFVVPPHAACANAVGVAVSRVSLTLFAHFDGARGRVVMNGEPGRVGKVGDDDELVAICTEEVKHRALAAGADPRDLDDIRVLHCSSFDVVRGSFRTFRIADIVVQVAPGITAEAR
ncbi:MAG: hydantoinase/oxoprolinase family protein [Methanolinea sp.]|jgi:N-methylhydantoinase A/oxoprolinase/acetone carboxylase beta subunit|nr:hydantoinase/oxoprolinase family protein [Methanolinea sp.]